MKPIVAIYAQGTMGAGIAKVLTQHDVAVLTSLEGRSGASAGRARAAGMQDVPFEALLHADILLAVLPPAQALPFAQRMGDAIAGSSAKPMYVDCNAVSPSTLKSIERPIVQGGGEFVDVGIIGQPPSANAPKPRLYAAGEGAARLAILNDYGLDVRVMHGQTGAASALKMSYGGITKGFMAVASAMILGATRAGVAADLQREFAASQPTLFASLAKSVPDMLPKAYRWVAEMHEISDFVASDPAAAAIYRGAGDLFAQLAVDVSDRRLQADALTQFFTSDDGPN